MGHTEPNWDFSINKASCRIIHVIVTQQHLIMTLELLRNMLLLLITYCETIRQRSRAAARLRLHLRVTVHFRTVSARVPLTDLRLNDSVDAVMDDIKIFIIQYFVSY